MPFISNFVRVSLGHYQFDCLFNRIHVIIDFSFYFIDLNVVHSNENFSVESMVKISTIDKQIAGSFLLLELSSPFSSITGWFVK